MRVKTIVAIGGALGVAWLNMAKADTINEYEIIKHVKLKAHSQQVYPVQCDGMDHAFRSGAYIVKADGKIAAYNNPVLQQVPIQDGDNDRIIGMQFGLSNTENSEKNVTVWLSCISDNNS